MKAAENDAVSSAAKIGSAVFYGKLFHLKVFNNLLSALASILITTVNKSVLTSYKFPSANILSLGQMACTIVVLFIAKLFGFISGVPVDLHVNGKLLKIPEINFLCVHKNLRAKKAEL